MTDNPKDLVTVIAEEPCLNQWVERQFDCTGHKTKHPECAAAAIQRWLASDEVHKVVNVAIYNAWFDKMPNNTSRRKQDVHDFTNAVIVVLASSES